MGTVQIDIRPRQAGKTWAVIQWFLANPEGHLVLCPTEQRAHLIRQTIADEFRAKYGAGQALRLVEEMDLSRNVISISNFDRNLAGRKTKKIKIDQADDLLSYLLGPHTLEGVTWSA